MTEGILIPLQLERVAAAPFSVQPGLDEYLEQFFEPSNLAERVACRIPEQSSHDVFRIRHAGRDFAVKDLPTARNPGRTLQITLKFYIYHRFGCGDPQRIDVSWEERRAQECRIAQALRSHGFSVPRVIPTRHSPRLAVTEWVHDPTLEQIFRCEGYEPGLKALGRVIHEFEGMHALAVAENNRDLFHTDPNPANFLVGDRISFLDSDMLYDSSVAVPHLRLWVLKNMLTAWPHYLHTFHPQLPLAEHRRHVVETFAGQYDRGVLRELHQSLVTPQHPLRYMVANGIRSCLLRNQPVHLRTAELLAELI